MAFSTAVHDRNLEEMRLGNGQTRDAPKFPSTYTPLRSPSDYASAADARATLQRRFTTDSMMAPHISTYWDPNRLQHMPVTDSLDLAPGTVNDERQRIQQMLQQKHNELEQRRLEKRNYEVRLKLMELQSIKDEEELFRIAQKLDRIALEENGHDRASMSVGHSQPTTPPEFRENTFARTQPGALHGASALATPPIGSHPESQQLITPPAEDVISLLSPSSSRSVPQSRRNSDENTVSVTPTQAPIGGQRSVRNSLPSNVIDRAPGQPTSSRFGLGQVNTAGFLFDDDVENKNNPPKNPQQTTSPDVKSYLQMMDTNDKFPILTSRFNGQLSASSAALDLALTQKANGLGSQQGLWESNFTRTHRPAQHSLPVNAYPYTPTSNSSPKGVPQTDSPAAVRRYERSSTDFGFSFPSEDLNAKFSHMEVSHGQHPQMPKLQASFSTSDLPTMRSTNTIQSSGNYGRGPIDRQRHSREPSLSNSDRPLTGGAFGPPLSANMGSIQVMTPPGISPLPSPGLYGGYGHINVNSMNPAFHSPFGAYPVYGQNNKNGDANHQNQPLQGRNTQKRNHDGEANRFANIRLESLVNEIYTLCKDQHGCRYLQKKLEENNPDYVEMIFRETHTHVVELMTDPFGNYLCQKLLEHATDEQRTVLVTTAAPNLVEIALNQHGTRALQKMIEYLSTPEQIQIIVHALESKVVELIQDLNGNHVIQKCLNRLKPDDAQFIFDAVGEHCIPVGTHRHGCCVLQRCIDHASGNQKIQLIQKITAHSLELVQDAFGNYVVQYILDLGEPKLSEPVILRFAGRVCELARQKFSSNVIEKCIRVAEPSTKKILIDEMVASGQIEHLLRDQYANYVIQTSIDYADAGTRQRLHDSIMPLLPLIRNFPYGRRISSKLSMVENKPSLPYQNGVTSPGHPPAPPSHSRSNSYSTPARQNTMHNPAPVRPTPVQQHSFPVSFRSEMGTQFLM